ncbi:MAG: M42 family metallopeptidase [Oscillospiraceae bacterium]
MLDTLKTLCYLSGVSGFEDEVRDYILERAMPFADEITTDPMGNLMVFKKGKVSTPERVMLCAHMDEVGLIVTGVNEEGCLRFSCVGGIDRRVLIGKSVFVGPERIAGVIGIKPIHLTTGDEEKGVPKVEDLYIDIGCADREEAEKLVTPGDFCSFDDTVVEFGSGWLKAKAIDDRVGCAAMLKLIESDLPCDTWFVFTVQEEVGTRGAAVAAHRVGADVALVLEGTTATNIPGVEDGKMICEAGKGLVISFMDRGTIYDRGLYRMLGGLAEKNGIPWQTKRCIAGGTDASAIQRSGTGVRTAVLACAVRNIHSPACVGAVKEFEDLPRLAMLFLESFAANGIN